MSTFLSRGYPVTRLRRLRISATMRRMLRETSLTPNDLIAPMFVRHGGGKRVEISSMPGIYQWSPDLAAREVKILFELGIPAVILFGIPKAKDPVGKENFADDGIVQQAIKAIKAIVPDMVVITDLCLCEYTDHGHCGIVNRAEHNHPHLPRDYALNEPTLEILARAAISHAEAGADMVAPSGMMDGMVAAIREALDEKQFEHLPILSYSVKYASAFYGPFRDAAESPPSFGDRKSHQMDPGNRREALRESALDIAEGADVLMVKPALPYLDVIREVRDAFPEIPLAAYNVSGEYAMLKA
ncbi:MAG: porphobilinogen synthase, partial [Anaerolineales bacterium]